MQIPGQKELPPGFLAMDLAAALRKNDSTLQLFDPDDDNKQVDLRERTIRAMATASLPRTRKTLRSSSRPTAART